MKPYPYTSYPHTHLYLYAYLPRISLFLLLRPPADMGQTRPGRPAFQLDGSKSLPRVPHAVFAVFREKFQALRTLWSTRSPVLTTLTRKQSDRRFCFISPLALADPAYRDYLRQIPVTVTQEALLRLAADYAAGNHI